MNFYNIPGAADITPLNDLRGDGLDGDDHALARAEFAGSRLAADENDPIWDNMGADELVALGWDPFKAIKKTVKKASSAVGKVTGAVTNPLARAVSRIPVVGKAGASAIRATGQLANPLALAQPKNLLASQLNVAKQSLSAAKQLAKSPVVKTVVTGAAIVFPPIGVPAAAALATAAAVAAGVDSAKPGVRRAARQIVANTAGLAKQGDKGAQIALAQIATQKQALVAGRLGSPAAGAKRLVFDVLPGGRISRIAV